VDLRRTPGVDVIANKALIAYLKIIAELNRNAKVLAYRKDERLALLAEEEDFKVRMGFGLHAGWAIEGAVGSIHKVDATYLSPHVNLAARLETASRQYGVPLLLSQQVHELFSHDVQGRCRRLDVVTVKGSANPIPIYTYDAFQDQKFQDVPNKRKKVGNTSVLSVKLATSGDPNDSPDDSASGDPNDSPDDSDRVRETLFVGEENSLHTGMKKQRSGSVAVINGKSLFFLPKAVSTEDFFDSDYDVVILRAHITDAFLVNFESGVSCYLSGQS
jgi:hypothetical protein